MDTTRKLLIFAKAPEPGRVKTRLGRTLGARGACQVYEGFLADLTSELLTPFPGEATWWVDGDGEGLRAATRSDAPVRQQPPGDLGARLSAGFSSAFAPGNAHVVAIGADCPQLRPAQLERDKI